MTFSHGKVASIKMDNAAGTLVDISSISNSVDVPKSLGTGETTGFQLNDKTYIAGLRDGTISIGGSYDNTLDAILQAAFDAVGVGTIASLTVEYGPQGTAAGKPKETFEIIPTSYSKNSATSSVGTFKFDGQRTGPTAYGVFP